jgi:Ca2+-binding RTX toxin-like protein
MTTVISANLSGTGILIRSPLPGSDYRIEAGVTVISSGSKAILLRGGDHDLTVEGLVEASTYGVVLGQVSFTADYDNSLVVSQSGVIKGGAVGVDSWGSSAVMNRGTIVGGDIGLRLSMSGATEAEVTNHGTITGGKWGIDSSAAGIGRATVVNHGTVKGGACSFVDRGGAGDRLVNRGVLDGDVDLGAGSDRFDNRGGMIKGEVLFGTGADIALPGGSAETFLGGGGVDTLDFKSGAGLRVSLASGTGSGRAQGDRYVGFERVLGSDTGADVLFGDDWDNVLEGSGGNDDLRGGKGEDSLLGGTGADALHGGSETDRLDGGSGADKLTGGQYGDQLRGGDGDDAFLFTSIRDAGDCIADFSAKTGNNDRFLFDADGFGAGLNEGVLAANRLRHRDDNQAQDSDDRFVFRTTDRSLWFDSDGSGGAKAVMIADLQAGAVVVAQDILLV